MPTGLEISGEGAGTRAGRAAEVFVWPPRPAVLDPALREHEPDGAPAGSDRCEAARARGALLGWVGAAEEAWLGVCGVSWREAASRAGWRADEPEAYCPRCGTSAGPYEADADGCPACRGRRLAWVRAVRLGGYEGLLRDAVLAGKYTAWRRVCRELGADLGVAVASALGRSGVDPTSVAVCPVPTSARRRLARGVDHTLVMGREVARATGGELVRGLRRRHVPTQTGLSGSARRRNVSGSFRPRDGVCQGLCGRVVVLVDDVRTTGATLSAAARALQGSVRAGGGVGAVVWTAVAGVTPRPGSGVGGLVGRGGSGENRHDR